ncbi:MAG: glutamyl-tRNA reductase [Bacteroidetes bacterium]|nr:glutamyl-tRNA reductase [Bacteroidota bacterium]MBU1483862.1 glutamyl-tRNA reductase [Bacteroidota bacterium]MBU2266964.1 glutamyl-tRNA reductase [Bacteroidota bacterium]MBU2374405.1 glutamyl-tRNA reductase [Bacteroidota bacterium]
MKYLKVIAFTHKQIDLKELGCLVLCNEAIDSRLELVKSQFDIPEIFYLATCNRVEFIFTASQSIDKGFVRAFLSVLHGEFLESQRIENVVEHSLIFEQEEALNHLMRVSSSLESLVVGEKEILAQVRKAYEYCREKKFTGDYLRMVMNRVVKTAKEVYTYTNISKNPISVVSLAYRKIKALKMCSHSRILIIGAGETNQNIAKYLKKHTFTNFFVFNRTLSKAQTLAKELGGEALSLDELKSFNKGFDVIITCTSATEPILTNEIYQKLLKGEESNKLIVDLAVPYDTAPEVIENNKVQYIEIKSLQDIANKNLQERYQELINGESIIEKNIKEFRPILKQRRVELAMKEVPQKIKEIKDLALNAVFADEVNALDENSRAVLEKVMNYMEKKYISVPMVMAKDILVNND